MKQNASTAAVSHWGGMRSRTSIALLAALLIASVAVSVYTMELLKGQRTLLEDAVRESHAHALALLADRLEQSLTTAIRQPLDVLSRYGSEAPDAAALQSTLSAFPYVQRILFLDEALEPRATQPAAAAAGAGTMDMWLARRVAHEDLDRTAADAMVVFLESIEGNPTLFAVYPTYEETVRRGWVLVQIDVDALQSVYAMPLLGEFSTLQHGSVLLQPSSASWDGTALTWPLKQALPGWLLVFKPDPVDETARGVPGQYLVLFVTASVVLALIVATFAVWRELRREHAIIELRHRFVANVSHELKTPLALIRMYAETLYMKRIADPERQQKYHRTILREAERLSAMIETVLDFARLERGVKIYHLTARDLAVTVRNVIDEYRRGIDEKSMQLNEHCDDVPPVAHDPYGIRQILFNLLDNAAKYGDPAEAVDVTLEAVGEEVVLAVTDHGPGIPPEERARLRTPFQRGAGLDPASGTGLGLALVEQIAAAHDARFSLETPADHVGLRAVLTFRTRRG